MAVTAKLKYLRIAPRKVRLVADVIRGRRVEEAEVQLGFVRKKSAEPLKKLLGSAVASAKHNFKLDKSNLFISKITVDEGPKLKRWRPASRGRALPIEKKTSHITLVLDIIEKEKEKPKKRVKKVRKIRAKKEVEKEKAKKEVKRARGPRPKADIVSPKPKRRGGFKRIFRRKAF